MIDFILFCFVVGVFYGGFWCGNKFNALGNMWTASKAQVRAWFA